MSEPPPAATSPAPDTPTEQQRRGMRNAILGQSVGHISGQAFSNGLLLLYFNSRGFDPAAVLFFLALPEAFQFLLVSPSAFYADRLGIKKLAFPGQALQIAGFSCLAVSGFFDGTPAYLWIAAGCVLIGIGLAVYESGWYALLTPLVPEGMRGGFFGRLRFSWQTVALFVYGIFAAVLTEDSPVSAFQAALAVLTAGLVLRIYFYARIPELERPHPEDRAGFFSAMAVVMRSAGYTSFSCYVFLLTLFTATVPLLFGLVEKKVLLFGDDTVVWMGNLLMAGSMAGFLIGGRAVDKLGTKSVFLVCHFGFGVLLVLFLLRGHVPILPMTVTVGALNFLFGLALASSSIAMTTETLALLPAEHRSLAASFSVTLLRAGRALGGFAAAWALNLGLLADQWQLWGQTMSAYDALILVCAVMVVLLVVTLGLVPSVLRKSEWIPRG